MTPLLIVLMLAILAVSLVNANPAKLARSITMLGPIAVGGTGFVLTFFGRASLGMPMIIAGIIWWRNNRNKYAPVGGTPKQFSTVRSAWLEMDLDHDTGDLDGTLLIGDFEGKRLSQLNEQILMDLHQEMHSDNESIALLEAYLDRRFPRWREDAHGSANGRQDSAPSSGPMTKEEAYEVLGLRPGAGLEEIKSAHRRLMKAVHPDSGGSTFLAARINQAKETLID